MNDVAKRIHLIAVGGSIMHNLAIALRRNGHAVSGSDDEIYDPARTRLQSEGLLPLKMGWDSERINAGIDLVLVGMHARKDNVELLKAQALGLRIQSFPEYIYQHAIDKRRVVVAGSHGKTTTTAMLLHVLQENRTSMDFLVGAQLEEFDLMVHLSNAPLMIIEGDEYLSSPIDPIPKIWHYQPQIAIVTGVAWDHMNVFPTFADYRNAFAEFLTRMEEDSIVFFDDSDPILRDIISHAGGHLDCRSYGPLASEVDHGITYLINQSKRYPIQLFGEHNLKNMSAAKDVLEQLGVAESEFYASIQSFAGAAKRQQLLQRTTNSIKYLDFAHAPSKVRATVQALSDQYPTRVLVACLELHTYSSMNPAFLPHYHKSLSAADTAIVFISDHALQMKRRPPLSDKLIRESFGDQNLLICRNAQQLDALLEGMEWENRNLLLMSSGTFDGLDLKKLSV